LADCVGAEREGLEEFVEDMLDLEGADEADESAEGAAVSIFDRGDGAAGEAGALGKFGLIEVAAEAMLFEAFADEFLDLGFGEGGGLSHILRKMFIYENI
jgi:hypothetical protein